MQPFVWGRGVRGVRHVQEPACASGCATMQSGTGIRAVPEGVGYSKGGGICTGAAQNGLHVRGCVPRGTHRQLCGCPCCGLSWGTHTAGGVA